MTPLEKIHARVAIDPDTGCWNWQGARHSAGYGQVWDPAAKKVLYTHRVALEAAQGPIPTGMHTDHLCRNALCCNPTHLEVVTAKVNSTRGDLGKVSHQRAAALTHCKNGHEFTPENTYTYEKPSRQPGETYTCRQCRACQRIRVQRAR